MPTHYSDALLIDLHLCNSMERKGHGVQARRTAKNCGRQWQELDVGQLKQTSRNGRSEQPRSLPCPSSSLPAASRARGVRAAALSTPLVSATVYNVVHVDTTDRHTSMSHRENSSLSSLSSE